MLRRTESAPGSGTNAAGVAFGNPPHPNPDPRLQAAWDVQFVCGAKHLHVSSGRQNPVADREAAGMGRVRTAAASAAIAISSRLSASTSTLWRMPSEPVNETRHPKPAVVPVHRNIRHLFAFLLPAARNTLRLIGCRLIHRPGGLQAPYLRSGPPFAPIPHRTKCFRAILLASGAVPARIGHLDRPEHRLHGRASPPALPQNARSRAHGMTMQNV
jgi:hypothetical protein